MGSSKKAKWMEHTDMISEKKFASLFNSFWQELIPTGEAYVRAMNMAKLHFNIPMDSQSDPSRRGIINEIGFLLFASSVKNSVNLNLVYNSNELEKVSSQAWMLAQNYQREGDSEIISPTQQEQAEGLQIAKRIEEYFYEMEPNETIFPSPMFSGCGYIDSCAGDLLVGNTLYEVKAGDRAFRLSDVKQVLVYLALNSSIAKYNILNVGFLNPRVGIYYKVSVSEFSVAISGKNSVELLVDIVDYISSGGVSR